MQSTIKKFGFYATISGGLLFLVSLLFLEKLSLGTSEVLGYATILIALSFVFFGIKHYRDKENDGLVSFGKALTIGILISLLAAVAFAIIDYLYTAVINPDFIAEYVERTGETEYADASSLFLAFFMFATVFIIGFIISLLSALILQRKN